MEAMATGGDAHDSWAWARSARCENTTGVRIGEWDMTIGGRKCQVLVPGRLGGRARAEMGLGLAVGGMRSVTDVDLAVPKVKCRLEHEDARPAGVPDSATMNINLASHGNACSERAQTPVVRLY